MIFGKHINKYYLLYSWMFFLGFLSLLAVDFFQLQVPKLYGRLIDGLDPNTPAALDKGIITDICYEMLIIAAVMVVGRFVWRVCFFGAGIRMEAKLRGEMFSHCEKLSRQFYQENKVGSLMSLFTNDLETVSECFGDSVLMLFDALLLGGLAVYKMAALNPFLTFLSLIPMVFMAVIGVIVGKHMQKKWSVRQEAYSKLSDFAQETFSGIAVIKAFVKEAKELMFFKKINRENEKANVDYTKASVLLNVFVTLFVQSVICVILGYGGFLAFRGVFSISELVMFVSYFSAIVWPVMALSMLIEMTSRGKASLARVSELLDTEVIVRDKEGAYGFDSEVKGEIKFSALTFAYPGEKTNALEDITFTVNAGENVGIIGKTGCGKTTLVDLLFRTYNVPDGSIYIDGRDINSLPMKALRENLAYAMQDNFLFSETIGANIAFSRGGEAPLPIIKEASSLAALDGNVSAFAKGYETMLGERGVTVSGGQKQRIAIARAVMKDAALLVLDDSFSAVDLDTEKTILENLREVRKGKTTVFIANRVSTVKDMEKIVFLEDGRVVDIGNHGELYGRCAEYAKMVDLQRLEDEIGEVNS
ncbi:MAG: ABC transporter ATP-binding protein [Eubacteriales bacterium]